jgi:hypothetical protein
MFVLGPIPFGASVVNQAKSIRVAWHNLKKLPDVADASLWQQERRTNKKHGTFPVFIVCPADRPTELSSDRNRNRLQRSYLPTFRDFIATFKRQEICL